MNCTNDALNPCWDNRPTDRPGLHWGAGLACAACTARAALADPVRDAAHELLAALEAVADYWAGGDVPKDIEAQMYAAIKKAKRDQHRPEDRPAPTFVSARESAIDEQAALYDDPYAWEDC